MASWQRVIVVMALLGAWESSSTAQGPTFRSATELVNLHVAVVGADTKPLSGLTQEQFEVFEDGVPQTLKFFAPGGMPLDIAVLLDTSASMAGPMPMVQQAATRLVRALKPGDRATVMGISNSLRMLQPLTSDLTAAAHVISQTTASGRTALYASI